MSTLRWAAFLALLACTGPEPGPGSDTDSEPDTDTDTVVDTELPGADDWRVIADQVPGGMYLAAWEDSGELLIVGGDLSAPSGTIARMTAAGLCVEEDAAEGVLWWIHGRADGDWYAVGEKGIIIHSVEGVRTREDVPTEFTLYGVYDDGTDVWAVGGDTWAGAGEVWRKHEGSWARFGIDLPGLAFKVWDGWVVGDGLAYRIEGEELVAHAPPDEQRLLTMRGASTTDAWAVGSSSTFNAPAVLHWDGELWSDQEVPPVCISQPLNGVWTDVGESVWVTGHYGTAAWFDGTDWSCADFPITAEHFHAVWPYEDWMVFLGGNLISTSAGYGTVAVYGLDPGAFPVTTCE